MEMIWFLLNFDINTFFHISSLFVCEMGSIWVRNMSKVFNYSVYLLIYIYHQLTSTATTFLLRLADATFRAKLQQRIA